MPSLRHYLLVSQKRWLVEWFCRNEHGGWDYTVLAEADDTLAITELNITLTLAEAYAETQIVPMRVNGTLESGPANASDASAGEE